MVVKRRDEFMLNKIQLVGLLLNKIQFWPLDAELLILAVEETLLLQSVGQ
jgi:hypothetical protein